MSDYITDLLNRYRKTGILLDTNLFLLYLVGTFDREEIPKFKRTKVFAMEDYNTLAEILKRFEKVVTTPNILTEVSNLSAQLSDHLRFQCFEIFANQITQLLEEYIPSEQVVSLGEFVRFGLTDTAIMLIARERYLVLTEDFRLSQYLQHIGIDVLNFNHIRPLFWRES